MTLTSDLLTSKPNQLIFVPDCMEAVNLVKVLLAIFMISCSQAIFDLIFGLAMSLTFDLLNSKSNQSISVPICNLRCKFGQIPVAILSIKWKNLPDHNDVEAEAESHLQEHRVQRSVDVIDAELIQRLAPEHQTEHDSQDLWHNILLIIVTV